MGAPVNLAGVRAAKEGAKKVRRTPPGPPSESPAADEIPLPPDCPVVPLGKDGKTLYYLNSNRQLIALADRDHSRLGLLGLFGNRRDFLYEHWPRCDKNGKVTGWRPELAAEILMGTCSTRGIWQAKERQRGCGAWPGDDGELVLHTGTQVMSFPPCPNPYHNQTSVQAGMVGRYVYSGADCVGVPASEPAPSGPDGPAQALLTMLATWQWRRGEIDAVLLLGWIGAGMIGGALRWRPMVWLTGGKGTGKSTLQEMVRLLFGGALIQTADTTAAGLYQSLGHQTLPIAIDELEAEEDGRRAAAVVKFARLASSGALMLRGGSDHRGVEFVVRSAFMFSSILIPPLTGQDRSRISVLDLDELTHAATSPKLDAKHLRAIGTQLRRRLVDGWDRLEITLAMYRDLLSKAGHSARACDQLGTLLTMADVLLYDGCEADDAITWVTRLSAAEQADDDDNLRDEERCLTHLLSSSLDVVRNGSRRSVGDWLRLAAEIDGDVDMADDARRVLGTYGLKILRPTPETDEHLAMPMMLAVANSHRGLAGIYGDSHWRGTAGSTGVWVQALRRLPGAGRAAKAQYFAGTTSKAVVVPLSVAIPLESVPVDKHAMLLRRG